MVDGATSALKHNIEIACREMDNKRKDILWIRRKIILFIILILFIGFIRPILSVLLIFGFIFRLCFSRKNFAIAAKVADFENSYKLKIIRPILEESFDSEVSIYPGVMNKETFASNDIDNENPKVARFARELKKSNNYSSYDKDLFQLLKESNIFSIGNVFQINDIIEINYKNQNILTFDVVNKKKSNDSKNSHVVNIFTGQLFLIPLKRESRSNIRILSEDYKEFYKTKENTSITGYKTTSYVTSIFNMNKDSKSVQTENADFNKMFNVFTEDIANLNYILTPYLMEKLMEIKNKVKCPLLLAFSDDYMCLGVKTNSDHYSIDYKKPLNAEEIISKTETETSIIKDIVHTVFDSDNL